MGGNADHLNRLKRLECPDSTYGGGEAPLVFDKAEGPWVWDCEGRKYVDLCAGFGALALGHNPEPLNELMGEWQASSPAPVFHGMGDVYSSSSKTACLEALVSALPSPLEKAALALSGGQAVEYAVKTAMLATGGRGVVAFDGAYHGLDLGVLPLNSRQDFRDPFQGWVDERNVRRLPFRTPANTVSEALHDLRKEAVKPAAIIVEPVQGRAGTRPAGLEWLAELRRLCDEEGVLLIFDEVFTGLGRSGRMSFAGEVPADLVCFGKALGGGLPLSACAGPAKVMDHWPANNGEALHTGTFFGHPFTCALAVKTLEAMKEQGLAERSRELGARTLARLQASVGGRVNVKDVRGEGLMIAIEAGPGDGVRLMEQLRERGIIALPSGAEGEALALTPPLNIDEAVFDSALQTIEALLRK